MRNKILLLLSSVIFSSHVYAECPPSLQKMNVQMIMSPLRYETNYTSLEIESLQDNKNSNILGLYKSYRKYNVRPSAEGIRVNGGKSCVAVTNLNVKISMVPVIYISREAQAYECTHKRVKHHELIHHQFEVNLAARSKPIIEAISRKHFQKPFLAKDQEEVKSILSYKNKELMDEINDYFKNTTQPLHAKLDSVENYEKESLMCSRLENLKLSSFLRIQRNTSIEKQKLRNDKINPHIFLK